MKWLFIIIALLNITFAAYNLFFVDGSKTKITLLSAVDKSQILLLNELDASALNKLRDNVLPSKTTIDEVAQVEPVELDKTSSKTELEPAADHDQATPQDLANIKTDRCYKLGPFSKDVMNDIRLILETEYNNQLSFGIETTSAITYYRIYIPPLKNKAKIKETLTLLNKNGLKDHYVMSIDGRKNAIALGVFKQRGAAEKVAAKATKIGLPTTIEAISDDKNSLYQLLIIFQKDQETRRYQEIISEKQFISIECEK